MHKRAKMSDTVTLSIQVASSASHVPTSLPFNMMNPNKSGLANQTLFKFPQNVTNIISNVKQIKFYQAVRQADQGSYECQVIQI